MFTLFLNFKECSYLRNQYLIEMGFGSKGSILNGQVIYVEKSKLNVADMWLIPLDRVTLFIKQLKILYSSDHTILFKFFQHVAKILIK